MASTLYIVRHGHAMMQAASDAERPLSSVGEQEAERAAQNISGINPDIFIASPYLRAQQTANIVKNALQIDTAIKTVDQITPDDHPIAVADVLEQLQPFNTLLMVSHNPLVSALVSWLVDGHFQGPYSMATASVACIELEHIGAGQGTLKWLKHAN